jgi:hypothetical protein
MKRQKRVTKRERKDQDPNFRPGPRAQNQQHIHCIACGRHVDASELSASPPSATTIICDHGSRFVACIGCTDEAQLRIDEHDRTGQPVETTAAWH